MYYKHPRTFHLPWSPGIHESDRVLTSTEIFQNNKIVITEKRDGECTSLYPDGTVHARSISGTKYPWQTNIKRMWNERCFKLPSNWRIVGENLTKTHSIHYDNLDNYLEVFAIFDEYNCALDWFETVEFCNLFELKPVPVLWTGFWNEWFMKKFHETLDLTKQEGYVIRLEEEILYEDWGVSVAKWVRPNHNQLK